jgi:hypothetical protein
MQVRLALLGTGDWISAGSALRRRRSGSRGLTCTGSGTWRRSATPSWPGGRRTRRAPEVFRTLDRAQVGHHRGIPRSQLRGTPIRTHESTDALVRKLAEGKAKILPATVSRSAQRWFVSFAVEVEREVPDRHPRPGTVVGIDLGVTNLTTAVDHRGRVIRIPGPRPLRAALRRLRRVGRAHSCKQKGSANRRKSAQRLARIHARIANLRGPPRSQLRGDPLRLDALHQATTMLASRYATVGVEDLNVVGRLRDRRLARPLPTRPSGWCGTSLAPRPPGVVAGPSSPSASSLAPRPALGVGR